MPYKLLIDGNNFFVSSMMAIVTKNPSTPDVVCKEDPRQDKRYGILLHTLLTGIQYFCNSLPTPQQLWETNIHLVFDASDNWRRDSFPEYKASRKARRKESDFDWQYFYDLLHSLEEDLLMSLPICKLKKNGFEADDLIAYYAMKNAGPPVLDHLVIVSADKDMMQLLPYANIFNPRSKIFIPRGSDPIDYDYDLLEHLIRGDHSDGVPNMLSDDDVFTNENKRNKPIRARQLNELKEEIRPHIESENWLKIGELTEKYPHLNRNLLMIWFPAVKFMGKYNKLMNMEHNESISLYQFGNTLALFEKWQLNKLSSSDFWRNALAGDIALKEKRTGV